jgi:mRNA interferase YafQ
METIIRGEQLDQSYKPHPLKGQWVPSWECHVESDWLLIWQDENPGEIIFQRTGTHSELFTKKARK